VRFLQTGPNLSLLADEFGIAERERDLRLAAPLALAFYLPAAPMALLAGYWADR